jgi:hypothetical protein
MLPCVEFVVSFTLDHLKRNWMGELVIHLEGDIHHVVGGNIHDDEFAFLGKAKSIFAGRQVGALDVQFGLGDEKSLIFLRNISSISGSIDETCQYEFAVRSTQSNSISCLHRGRLSGEEVGARRQVLNVVRT